MRGGFTYRVPYDCTQPCSVNANPASCSPKYSTMSLRSNSPCTSTSRPISSCSLIVLPICASMNCSYSSALSWLSFSLRRAARTSDVCGNDPIVVVGYGGSSSCTLRRTANAVLFRDRGRPPLHRGVVNALRGGARLRGTSAGLDRRAIAFCQRHHL